MIKVLAIIGSPRKSGNTYHVVEKVIKHLEQLNQEISFETIFLSECNLEMCRGCFSCFRKGRDTCPLKDDLEGLEAKLYQADGIIYAAPTYAMGVPAIMKNFIDRFSYTAHRPGLMDKAFLAVTTAGGIMGMKQTLTQLSVLAFGRSLTKLGIPCPPVTLAGFDKRAEKLIHKASTRFYQSLLKKELKAPSLGDLFYFASFKAFCSNASYQKYCPADDEYYRNKDYFYPITGHPVRRFMNRLVTGLMQAVLRRMIQE